MEIYEELKESIIQTPDLITELKDPLILKLIDNILPYSVGMEIECDQLDNYNKVEFENIPDIMEVRPDSEEQRFRIPSGKKGIVCLFKLSEVLKQNCLINPLSGIHYQIDMTDCYHLLTQEAINENNDWILEELDTWDYKGSYNRRECAFKHNSYSVWVAFQDQFKTAEIRIGEMTFEYDLMMKRIIHCSEIIKKLKSILISRYNHVNLNLPEVQEDIPEIPEPIEPENSEEAEGVIRNRTIRRY